MRPPRTFAETTSTPEEVGDGHDCSPPAGSRIIICLDVCVQYLRMSKLREGARQGRLGVCGIVSSPSS